MLKLTAGLISGVLTLCLSQAIKADPKLSASPSHILVTLQVVEVPSTMQITVSDAHPASEIYKTLLQAPGAGAMELSLQTRSDFHCTAQCSRVLAFTAQNDGKPSLNLISAPTILEATPHVNTDGTITVRLNMNITSFVSATPTKGDTIPATTNQQMTITHTFTSGKTVLLGRALHTAPKTNISAGDEPKEWLEFVTVTVLPNDKTAEFKTMR